MNYSVEILLEQKTLLEDEMRFAEGKELEETKQRYTDVCTALNKLNLPDVRCGFYEFAKQYVQMKQYFNEFELLVDLPTGEKKGSHFFMNSDNNGGFYYKVGTPNSQCNSGWCGYNTDNSGIKLKIDKMTEAFFKPIGKSKPLFPMFPTKEKIKEYYYLTGESRLVESVDETRAINKIFYSDEFYNGVYELLKKMYNDRFYPNGG